MSGISSHILDISLGRPAAGVPVAFEHRVEATWQKLSANATGADGRILQMLPEGRALMAGTYRLVFLTDAYFQAQGVEALYPLVEITFRVRDVAGHYHIPLLLSANSYSTYRGS